MPVATVLIPTHDHGPLLRYSLASALAQDVKAIEVFVIGDGVVESAREIVAELGASDSRVRFFDNPKGPNHGEVYRDAALKEASGTIVCYLADDDIWLPGHVGLMCRLLDDADFAHSLPLRVRDGAPHVSLADLSIPYYREQLVAGFNVIPLSSAAHTLEAYRRLERGWTTTPGMDGDRLRPRVTAYMWAQFVRLPGARLLSSSEPTVVHLPSDERRGWSIEQRVAEMKAWHERLAAPENVASYVAAVRAIADAKRRSRLVWLRRLVRERLLRIVYKTPLVGANLRRALLEKLG
jgi:glycosyltransferase involved in cell wall biosynthesis